MKVYLVVHEETNAIRGAFESHEAACRYKGNSEDHSIQTIEPEECGYKELPMQQIQNIVVAFSKALMGIDEDVIKSKYEYWSESIEAHELYKKLFPYIKSSHPVEEE